MIGVVPNAYPLHLGPSRLFPGHRFGSRVKVAKNAKNAKNAENAKYVSSNKGVFLEAWRPYRRHGDHAKGIGTMPKAWGPYRRRGDHAEGMGTMPKA